MLQHDMEDPALSDAPSDHGDMADADFEEDDDVDEIQDADGNNGMFNSFLTLNIHFKKLKIH